ncbi:nuclear protein es2 [Dipodascopsis tothii]|uniref:nuclear protein es2 n=1 Tax=Dipodascopsis tothii TaxID=44089 RepID=UPI0034CD3B62
MFPATGSGLLATGSAADVRQALIRDPKHSTVALPPAPPPAPRIHRAATVLEEDVYVDALSRIIARDYFPELARLQEQNEDDDVDDYAAGVAERQQRLRDVLDRFRAATDGRRRPDDTGRRPADTPAGNRFAGVDTPAGNRFAGADTPAGNRFAGVDTPAGNRFAGVDTPAGNRLSDPADSADAGDAGARALVDAGRLSLDQFQALYTSEDNESFNRILDERNQKNREKYAWLWAGNRVPGHRAVKFLEWQADQAERRQLLLTAGEDVPADDVRPNRTSSWTVQPRNALMFGVDGGGHTLEREMAARAKRINADGTRFDPALAPAPAPSVPDTRAETPNVNGFTFVTDTPSHFRVQDTPRRDQLHHRLVARAASTQRSQAARDATARSRTPGGRLTPAARRLLSSISTSRRAARAATPTADPRQPTPRQE